MRPYAKDSCSLDRAMGIPGYLDQRFGIIILDFSSLFEVFHNPFGRFLSVLHMVGQSVTSIVTHKVCFPKRAFISSHRIRHVLRYATNLNIESSFDCTRCVMPKCVTGLRGPISVPLSLQNAGHFKKM